MHTQSPSSVNNTVGRGPVLTALMFKQILDALKNVRNVRNIGADELLAINQVISVPATQAAVVAFVSATRTSIQRLGLGLGIH